MSSGDDTLTDAQRAEAVEVLRRYLAECFVLSVALPLPLFREVERTYWPVEPASGRGHLGRRSEGVYSDPTALGGIALAEGVTVVIPEVRRIPAAAVRELLESLPGHLYVPLAHLVILPADLTAREVAGKLHVSQRTVFRRVEEALAHLLRQLYGPRWSGAEFVAGLAVLADMAVVP